MFPLPILHRISLDFFVVEQYNFSLPCSVKPKSIPIPTIENTAQRFVFRAGGDAFFRPLNGMAHSTESQLVCGVINIIDSLGNSEPGDHD